ANQEELKFLLNLVKPEYFVPVHGEYRHLVHHARLARGTGMPEDRVIICEDGDMLVLGEGGIEVERRVAPAGYLYVDGGVGDAARRSGRSSWRSNRSAVAAVTVVTWPPARNAVPRPSPPGPPPSPPPAPRSAPPPDPRPAPPSRSGACTPIGGRSPVSSCSWW